MMMIPQVPCVSEFSSSYSLCYFSRHPFFKKVGEVRLSFLKKKIYKLSLYAVGLRKNVNLFFFARL